MPMAARTGNMLLMEIGNKSTCRWKGYLALAKYNFMQLGIRSSFLYGTIQASEHFIELTRLIVVFSIFRFYKAVAIN